MLTSSIRVTISRAGTRNVAIAATTRRFFDFRFFSAAPDDDAQAKLTPKVTIRPAAPESISKPVATSEKELPISYADISRAHVVSDCDA